MCQVHSKAAHSSIPNGLGNVAKGVDSGSANGFLVSFDQVQQLKTDPHPLPCRDKFCPSVSNPPNKINAVLLYFLMP